jgi:hypothetical protein
MSCDTCLTILACLFFGGKLVHDGKPLLGLGLIALAFGIYWWRLQRPPGGHRRELTFFGGGGCGASCGGGCGSSCGGGCGGGCGGCG